MNTIAAQVFSLISLGFNPMIEIDLQSPEYRVATLNSSVVTVQITGDHWATQRDVFSTRYHEALYFIAKDIHGNYKQYQCLEHNNWVCELMDETP